MPAYAAATRAPLAPRASGARASRRGAPVRVPGAGPLPSARPRCAPRASPVSARAISDPPGQRMSDSEYAEFRAEDAIKRAVEGWKRLDLDAQGTSETEDFERLAREADREVSEMRRRADAEAAASAERLRVAEAASALWESRAKEVRRDLEFAQKQLQELRNAQSSSSSS